MKILAIETTQKSAGLALLVDDRPPCELQLEGPQRSAAVLAVGMRELLRGQELRPNQIDLVAVAIGPGSFTGLRVGVTAAKTFAYAAGADVKGVNSLKVIASAVPQPDSPIWTVMDAQRGQVFVAQFVRRADKLETVFKTHILDIDSWLARLRRGDVVAGPMLHKLSDRLPDGVHSAEPDSWLPRAAIVGAIAKSGYDAGERDDVWQLVPQYFRQSAAEEKLAR